MDTIENFDRVAPYYDRLVRLVFSNSMKKAQAWFLDEIPDHARILVLGGGSGNWLKSLLSDRKTIRVTYIDASQEMLRLARKNSNNSNQIDFIYGTEDSIPTTGSFDVIITYCYLDLFPQELLTSTIRKIQKHAKPGATWLVVDFVERFKWHTVMLRVMYIFFRMSVGMKNQKLSDWQAAMCNSGAKKMSEKLFYGEFIKSIQYRML